MTKHIVAVIGGILLGLFGVVSTMQEEEGFRLAGLFIYTAMLLYLYNYVS